MQYDPSADTDTQLYSAVLAWARTSLTLGCRPRRIDVVRRPESTQDTCAVFDVRHPYGGGSNHVATVRASVPLSRSGRIDIEVLA